MYCALFALVVTLKPWRLEPDIEKAVSELVGPVRHDIWDVHCASSRWSVATNLSFFYTGEDPQEPGCGLRPCVRMFPFEMTRLCHRS